MAKFTGDHWSSLADEFPPISIMPMVVKYTETGDGTQTTFSHATEMNNFFGGDASGLDLVDVFVIATDGSSLNSYSINYSKSSGTFDTLDVVFDTAPADTQPFSIFFKLMPVSSEDGSPSRLLVDPEGSGPV